MEELEEIEKLIISNKFKSKLAKLNEQLDIKSDDKEFIHSVNGICRSFFQYDKLTIAFSNKDNSSPDNFFEDGFKDDINEGNNFEKDMEEMDDAYEIVMMHQGKWKMKHLLMMEQPYLAMPEVPGQRSNPEVETTNYQPRHWWTYGQTLFTQHQHRHS